MVCNLVLYSLQALHILSLLIEDPRGQHRVCRKDCARRPFYHCLMMTFWCQISRKGTLMVFTNRQLWYSQSWKIVMPPDWCFRRLSQVLMESCVISAFKTSHHLLLQQSCFLLSNKRDRAEKKVNTETLRDASSLPRLWPTDRPTDLPLRIKSPTLSPITRLTAWLLTPHPTSLESVNGKSSPTVCKGTDIDTHVLLTRSSERYLKKLLLLYLRSDRENVIPSPHRYTRSISEI